MLNTSRKIKNGAACFCGGGFPLLFGVLLLAACTATIPTPIPTPPATTVPTAAVTPGTFTPHPPTNTPPPALTPVAGAATPAVPVSTPLPVLSTLTPDARLLERGAPPAMSGPAAKPAADVPPEVSQNPFLILFPELARAPAPDWLDEGVRVTYRTQSATINQDPNAPGASGAGYMQYDLVAWDREVLAATWKLYLDSGEGPLLPATVGYSLGLAGVGEFWVSPTILPNAERVANNQLVVVHMPAQVNGQTYQAVRFQYADGKAQYVWMFDEKTGLLIFYSNAIGTENDARRQLTQVTLAGQRAIRVPWQGRTIPDWVRAGGSLRYDGSQGGMNFGTPLPELPQSVRADIKSRDLRWTRYDVVTGSPGALSTPSARITGVQQLFDGLWLSQEARDVLRDGQELDRDPITGARLSVARAPATVTLIETVGTYSSSLTYDLADGVLSSIQTQSPLGAYTTIVVRLRLADRR